MPQTVFKFILQQTHFVVTFRMFIYYVNDTYIMPGTRQINLMILICHNV